MANSTEYGACPLEEAPDSCRSNVNTMADKKTDVKAPKLTPGWERTKDIIGHVPKFDMKCVRCKVSLGKDTTMQLRHSGLRLTLNAQIEMYNKTHPQEKPQPPREDEFDPDGSQHGLAYKCPYCAWFIRFHVSDDVEYLQELYKRWDYSTKFVPIWETDEISDDEQKKIEAQLESLGYWGGR